MKALKDIKIRDFIKSKGIIIVANKEKYLIGYKLNKFIIKEKFKKKKFEDFKIFKEYIINSFGNEPVELFIQIIPPQADSEELYSIASYLNIIFGAIIKKYNSTNKVIIIYNPKGKTQSAEIEMSDSQLVIIDEIIQEILKSGASNLEIVFE